MSLADLAALWEPARAFLAGGLALFGAVMVLIGSVGLLRFPDFYTRLHAASVTDTAGVTLVVAGLMLEAGWSLISLKLLFIWIFLFLSGPAASHAVANAAHTAGLAPLVGKVGRGWRAKDGEGGA